MKSVVNIKIGIISRLALFGIAMSTTSFSYALTAFSLPVHVSQANTVTASPEKTAWDAQIVHRLKPLPQLSSENGCDSFSISSQALSSDSKIFALGVHSFVDRRCGGGSSSLTLWDLSTGKKINTLVSGSVGEGFLLEKPYSEQEPDDPVALAGDLVHDLAFTSDGKVLAGAMSDKTIKLWDGKTGTLIRTLKGHRYAVHAIAISPDNQTLISGSSDRTIKLWHLPTGRVIKTLSESQPVNQLLLSPNGQYLVSFTKSDSISDEVTIKLWNLKTGKVVRTFKNEVNNGSPVIFSLDSKSLITGGKDNIIKLWNSQTGTRIRSLTSHSAPVNSLAISQDGDFLASSSNDGSVKLWNFKTSQLIRTLPNVGAFKVAFHPDGKTMILGAGENIELWNWRIAQKVRTLQNTDYLNVSNDGKSLLTVDSPNYSVLVWR